jgi:hypothetical protein
VWRAARPAPQCRGQRTTVQPKGEHHGSHDDAPLAVNNLGLNTTQAKNWQCWLRDTGYHPGTIDGRLGTNSWKAAQRKFNDLGLGAGAVDGVVGTKTRAAFADFNSIGC